MTVNVVGVDTVGDLVDYSARTEGNNTISFPDSRLTWSEFARRSVRMAATLRHLGVRPGDSVGLLLPAGMQCLALIVAAARLGAVAVPISTRFKASELAYVIENADVRVLVMAARFDDLVTEALPSCVSQRSGRLYLPEAPVLRHIVRHGDTGHVRWCTSWSAVEDEATVLITEDTVKSLQREVADTDVALMIYTSGTSARPKGCLHTHASLLSQGAAMAERLELRSSDRFWTPLPLFHIGGIDVLLACLAAQCAMVHTGPFQADTALAQLAEERCTVAFPAFETIWLAVLGSPGFTDADLSAIRLVINVGTPERMRLMQERVPHAVQISCTGSTEAGGFCCIGSPHEGSETRAVSCGPMVPGMEGRIVDPDTGQDLPDGTPGEFLFRGATRFLRYYRDPDLTARRIDADGWYHSGDLLKRDAEGRYVFVSRLTDMLKVGGENVAAAEVEDHLAAHPAVSTVQVVGVRDQRYGEVPAAFVQLARDHTAVADELIDHCLGRIATFKVPRYVRFVTDWPMSGTKVQKFKLRERLTAELDAAGMFEAPKLSHRLGR